MARAMLRVGLVATAVLCVTSAHAHAADRLDFTGSVWASYAFEATDGAEASLRVHAETADVNLRAVGVWLTAPGGATSRFLWTATAGGTSASVRVEPLGVAITPDVLEAGDGWLSLDVTMRDLDPGMHRLVAIVATDGAPRPGYAVWHGVGAALVAQAHGDDVFARVGEDFDASLSVNASTMGARATVMQGAYLDREVAGRLHGWFAASGSGTILRYTGPGTIGDGESSYAFAGAAPGTYRFEATGAGTVFAWGASVAP